MNKIPGNDALIQAGNDLVEICHGASARAGWWHHEETGDNLAAIISNPHNGNEELLAGALVCQKLALIHSEVSEALEGIRKDKMDEHLPSRPSGEVELADAVIRIADLCGALGYDLGGAIAEKMAYNARRADHRPEARAAAGGKRF